MARPDEVPFGHMHGKTYRLKVDRKGGRYLGYHDAKGAVMEDCPFRKGDLVKVVMVSRFGDCGITHDLKAENGYQCRVDPEDLEDVR